MSAPPPTHKGTASAEATLAPPRGATKLTFTGPWFSRVTCMPASASACRCLVESGSNGVRQQHRGLMDLTVPQYSPWVRGGKVQEALHFQAGRTLDDLGTLGHPPVPKPL
jgi:hypothetical protein